MHPDRCTRLSRSPSYCWMSWRGCQGYFGAISGDNSRQAVPLNPTQCTSMRLSAGAGARTARNRARAGSRHQNRPVERRLGRTALRAFRSVSGGRWVLTPFAPGRPKPAPAFVGLPCLQAGTAPGACRTRPTSRSRVGMASSGRALPSQFRHSSSTSPCPVWTPGRAFSPRSREAYNGYRPLPMGQLIWCPFSAD